MLPLEHRLEPRPNPVSAEHVASARIDTRCGTERTPARQELAFDKSAVIHPADVIAPAVIAPLPEVFGGHRQACEGEHSDASDRHLSSVWIRHLVRAFAVD